MIERAQLRRAAILAGMTIVAMFLAAPSSPSQMPSASARVQGSTQTDVDQLAWMAGCWEGTLGNGATYEEVWLAPRGGMMLGMSRMSREGRMLSFEFASLGVHEGAVVFNAQPSGRPPTPFRATEITSSSATFANPEHDFPQRVIYRRASDTELHARIEGERGGQLRGMDFRLRRANCPG